MVQNTQTPDSSFKFVLHQLAGMSGSLMQRLQSVLNATARLVFSMRKSEHTTPLLRELHWLKVPERIQYRLCVLAFRCLHGLAPSYLSPVDPLSATERSLAAARAWNSLLPSIYPVFGLVVAGILLSTSKDSPVRCIISSLTLNAILELNFVQ